MAFWQKLVTSFASKERAASIEAESRSWMMQCPSCRFERSVWDAGGIRAGAAGNPKRLMRCSKCGERTWHRIYKKDESQASAGV